MDFKDLFSKLFHVDISKLKEISLVKITVNNTVKNVDNRTLVVNLNSLSPEQKELIKSYISPALHEDGVPIIAESASERIDDVQDVVAKSDNKSLIEYFQDKLNPSDIEALSASIYIKEVAERGESVSSLKLDLRMSFGDRGNNISNLYSSGYFESQIRPLYEEMSSIPGFEKNQFLGVYETIVTECPFAVFINRRMTEKETVTEITAKVSIAKKYGIKKINIHGIGKENVDKILTVLVKLPKNLYARHEILYGGSQHVTVRLYL